MNGLAVIHSILGEYTYNFIVISSFSIPMIISILLYCRYLPKRRYFVPRLIFAFLICIASFYLLAVLRTKVNGIFTRLLTMLVTYFIFLLLIHICYEGSPYRKLMAWCAAYATEEISSRVFTLCVMLSGNVHYETISLFSTPNDTRDWLIMFLIRTLVIIGLWLAFGRERLSEADRETKGKIPVLSMLFALWLVFFQALSREYMRESDALYFIINLSGIVAALFVLLLRTGIFVQNRYRQEIALTERLMREERKQYDSVKENIELVNMRCHDLRHQLDDLSCKLTEEELKNLKQALHFYDSGIKTGNEVLDVVIYEKQLVFDKEGVRFTCMADGSLLSFMRTTHIYSLFNNALGNALEAVRKLDDPEKRIIDLSVRREGDSVEITVTNYFDGQAHEPTTKDDKNRHGFGIKSMKYIASLYNGELETSASGEVFELICRIPIQD